MNSKKSKQDGFTYIEVIIAVVILVIGIMAQLSALSLSMFRIREVEQRNTARQIASSTIESIFAARDLGSGSGINSWDAVNLTTSNSKGIFLPDWRPIRTEAGIDGIQGTADDACAASGGCVVGGYTNTAKPLNNFQRKIVITDVVETGVLGVKKRRVDVSIRYYVGQLERVETLSTLLADLPMYD